MLPELAVDCTTQSASCLQVCVDHDYESIYLQRFLTCAEANSYRSNGTAAPTHTQRNAAGMASVMHTIRRRIILVAAMVMLVLGTAL